MEEQRHKAGQVIIQQGDSGLMFYLLEVILHLSHASSNVFPPHSSNTQIE